MKTINKYESESRSEKYLKFLIVLTMIILFILTCISFTFAQEKNDLALQNTVLSAGITENSETIFNNFETISLEGKVYLKWYVKDKNNNNTYIVENSVDEMNFETKGVVKSYGGKYEVVILNCFTDKNPGEGYSYYRIAAVDETGKKEYSKTNVVFVSHADEIINEVNNPMLVIKSSDSAE